jgi:hypothetical protein
MCTVRELLLAADDEGDDDDDDDDDERFLCFLELPGELDEAAAGEPEGEARDDTAQLQKGLEDWTRSDPAATQSYSLWRSLPLSKTSLLPWTLR